MKRFDMGDSTYGLAWWMYSTKGRVIGMIVVNSRGISLLTVVGQKYSRGLIKRIEDGTECAIGD